MAPPSALSTDHRSNGCSEPSAAAPHEPGLNKHRANVQMSKFPGPPKFDDKLEEREYLKGRLAAAFRIFGRYGFDEGVAGHITVRDPVEPTTFWVNPFGVAFSLIKKSDLIRVDHTGRVVDGGEDHVLYESFNGIVLVEKEGQQIAACLGNKKAALLQNHGLLTVGGTIEAAVFWFISLEKCCQAQLAADAAAGGRGQETVKIADDDAAFTNKAIGTPAAGWFSAKPLFDVIEKECGEDYMQ
ncbi:MAG: hypothetical protein LQ342_005855 [Letrouitia transgressa]|nr:MAG: hypothetical protein LQ342_005855 [Letrouitia transgressa]